MRNEKPAPSLHTLLLHFRAYDAASRLWSFVGWSAFVLGEPLRLNRKRRMLGPRWQRIGIELIRPS